MKKFLLIDGNLLLFKSFYAAKAININNGNLPCHLFFNSFFDILKKENPEYIFIAFDANGKTRRHYEYENYKSNRIKAPEELYLQKEIIINILNEMKICNFSKIGDEADDLIATVCEKYKNENLILIFSDDKDLLQLVDKNVLIVQKNKNKNSNEKYEKININNFFEKYNFNPKQIPDFKGIAGDTSDNLPGIKGIGPKTAIELLNKYKTLEEIYNNLNSLTERQKKLFLENKDNSFLCKKLAILNKNVEEIFDIEAMKINLKNFQSENVLNILNKYQLKKIINTIKKEFV